jgi:hypothetical protein
MGDAEKRNEFVEFTRSHTGGGEISDVAELTAKAIKDIVEGDSIRKDDKDVFIIVKEYVEWTLYSPGMLNDQLPFHWRLTVRVLANEKNQASEDYQRMFEEDLVTIMTLLIGYY